MINALKTKTRKSIALSVESLDSCDFEDEGFINGDVAIGTSIASFNFGISDNFSDKIETADNKSVTEYSIESNSLNTSDTTHKANFFIPNARGFTPPIDGEAFTMKRGYQLRPSTLRKLHELKANHPDVNVYLNTILDAAILHYYNYIFNENGHF